MIKLIPFTDNKTLEPILFTGITFVFDPNNIVKDSPPNPISVINKLNILGYRWRVDYFDATKDDEKELSLWSNICFFMMLRTFIIQEKPIIFFGDNISSENFSLNEKDLLLKHLIGTALDKQVIFACEENGRLIIG